MSDAFSSDLEILVPMCCEPFAYHMNCCNSYFVSKAARAARSERGLKSNHRELTTDNFNDHVE
jgi:hypothetical protein